MSYSKHRQTLLRRNNEAQVLLAIRKHAPISRAQIAKATKLSLACVCGIVDDLIADGTLIETGTFIGPRGRPMELLEFNPNGRAIAGAWLTHDSMHVVVANPKAEILATRVTNVSGLDFASDGLDILANEIQKCSEDANKELESLEGVGLSIADKVDRLLGIIDSASEISGWSGVPIVRLLSERLKLPVYADNDVRAAAYASQLLEGDISGSSLYVTISRGLGCALLYNYEIISGSHGVAGEINHITIDRNGPKCICGNKGCLNTLASDINFICDLWDDLTQENAKNLPLNERRSLIEKGIRMAISGDPKARYALESFTHNLALGIANIINLFDPQSVSVAGTIIEVAPDVVMDMLRAEILKRVSPPARGIEIKAINDWLGFLLKGSVGLVLGQQFRVLHKDNLEAKIVSKL